MSRTRRILVRAAVAVPVLTLAARARAHHGWSSFDTDRPLWLEGRVARVSWRNPHAEFELELPAQRRLPDDLPRRPLPPQSSPVDGAALLARATLPTRADRRWRVELAPLSRLQAWKLAPLADGAQVGVLGYTFKDEKGDPLLRAEYLFVDGKAYGLRSGPA